MNWSLTDQEIAFRDEARAWLEANTPARSLPSMDTPEGFSEHRAWERELFDAGWVAVNWPREFGGRGATIVEWLLFEEAYYAAGAPGRVSQNGIFLLAPTLFVFGTTEQQKRWLPRMARAEEVWAQAWSEPGAGSDLASLRSTAVRTEGGWLLNGQKAWSTRASFADRAFGLFRSDPSEERHRGLTYVAFSLDAPGITLVPTRRLDGATVFADIFLEDVFVPDADVIGTPGEGWSIAMAATTPERGMTLRSPGRFLVAARQLKALHDAVKPTNRDVSAAVADCIADAHAYRARGYDIAERVAHHEELGAETSVDKLFWSQLDVRIHRLALELIGDRDGEERFDRQRWQEGFVFALSGPIYAGANEIQRNLVAQRVLGMPR